MAKFRKKIGVHYRKEVGGEVKYGPGSIIEATDAELRVHDPNMSTWELVGPADLVVELPKPVEGLRVQKREGEKTFDVINLATGLAINDVPLTRKEAFALIADGKTKDEPAKADNDTAGNDDVNADGKSDDKEDAAE